MSIDGKTAACVERAVRDVFDKKFVGQPMPFERARVLIYLEQAIVENVVSELDRELK